MEANGDIMILPKGRYKGYNIESVGRSYMFEVMNNRGGWKIDHPEVIEYITKWHPDIAEAFVKKSQFAPYTGEDLFPRGKHKGTRLKDVPADYLLLILDEENGWKDFPTLIDYLKSIELDLLSQAPNFKSKKSVKSKIAQLTESAPPATFICDKRTYASEKEARMALRTIRNGKDISNKKPTRVYECRRCSYWHLTSLPFDKYKEISRHSKQY